MSEIVFENTTSDPIYIVHDQHDVLPNEYFEITKYYCRSHDFWVDYYRDEDDRIRNLVADGDLIIYENKTALTLAQCDARYTEELSYPYAKYGTKNNLTATSDPSITDDETDGYGAGSIWINTVTNDIFQCTDASEDAANWEETTGGGSGGGDQKHWMIFGDTQNFGKRNVEKGTSFNFSIFA